MPEGFPVTPFSGGFPDTSDNPFVFLVDLPTVDEEFLLLAQHVTLPQHFMMCFLVLLVFCFVSKRIKENNLNCK